MRRTMNTNNYTLGKIAESKMDWSKVIAILEEARGILDSLEFKASEVGLKGAQMRVLMDYNVVKVIRTEDCWFQIDEDTMKKGSVNVYVFDTEVSDLLAQVKEMKRRKLLEEIKWHNEQIVELQKKIMRLYSQKTVDK